MVIFKNHYMLIVKYIFVIFLSLFVKRNFRGMGIGRGVKGPWDFEIFPSNFLQKIVFLDSSGENVILPLLALPAKIFWPTPRKSTIGPTLKKIFPGPMFRGTCSSVAMLEGYMARESLGIPL